MNRVVTASVIAVLILMAALGSFIYFNKYRSAKSSALKAVPTDAVLILNGKVNESLINTFANSSFLKNFTDLETVERLQSKLKALQNLMTADAAFKNKFEIEGITISVHAVKVDEFDFVYYLTNVNELSTIEINQKIQLLFDSIANETIRTYADVDVHDLRMRNSGNVFTYAIYADILIASYTPFLVEDAIRQLKAGRPITAQESFKKLQPKTQPESDLSIYINYKNLPRWLSTFCNQDGDVRFVNVESFADWSKLDIELKNNSCKLNGLTTANDTGSFINLFTGQTSQNIKAFSVFPRNTAVVKAFSLSDKIAYFERLAIYNSRFSISINNELPAKFKSFITSLMYDEYGLLITEPGSTSYSNNSYCYFNATNINETKKKLEKMPNLIGDSKNQSKVKATTYRNHQIVFMPYEKSIATIFGNSFENVSGFYYTDISNYIFIGNTNSALRVLVDAYEENNLITKSTAFDSFKKDLPLNANYLFYSQIKNSYYLLQSKVNKQWSTWLDDNRDQFEKTETYSYALKSNNSFFETSVYFKTSESTDDDVSVVWAAQLDYPIAIAPQLIETNDNLKFIAIQDSANQLYLINNSGSILWKKQLPEKILPPIYSLDVFKNGNRQLVFNTENNLWMLDFDSNEVSNFPIHLPSAATAALSAVDYDNTHDYRFYIPCSNGTVYGYQPSGKPIPGWNFVSKNDVVNELLQYFKVKSKDYLLASTVTGNIFALDRNGKTSLKISETVNKQREYPFHFENDSSAIIFSCLDTAGNTVKIDSTGNVTRNRKYQSRSLSNYYSTDINKDGKPDVIDVFSDEIIATDDAQKTILDYKTPENIDAHLTFSTDNRGNTLICFSNKMHNQIYMINMKGKLVRGMPVKGYTLPYLDDLNGDRIKKIITCGDSISVTVYDF
ncbi:MAG: hypothetical protein ABI723_17405 [Bacteroidia bacterium]